MTLKLAVAMQKGGVGKTVTSINLAGALADQGHDVLLVDADPQGGSTLKLGFREQYRTADSALFDVLSDVGSLGLDDADQLVVNHNEFDLLPSHLRNFRLEKYLYTEAGGHQQLGRALSHFDTSYEVVVVDSPPNLGPMADGALLATGHVLCPCHPNTIARDSLRLLFDEIETLEDKFDSYQNTTVGTVLNQMPSNGRIHEEIREWFTETFGEEYVFEVPDWVAIEHAIESESSIFGYDPEDAGYAWETDRTDDIRQTYHTIADHVEGYL